MNGMYGGMPPGGCGGGMMMGGGMMGGGYTQVSQGCGGMQIGGCQPMMMGGCQPVMGGCQGETMQMGGAPMMDPMRGGYVAGGCGGGQQMMQQGMGVISECEVFVEVMPEVQPNFSRGPNGTYIFELGPVHVRIMTQCSPQPPVVPGSLPHKPVEDFMLQMPGVQQVLFDPMQQIPPNAMAQDFVQKRGAVIEVPSQIGLNAQLKANSLSGSLVLEDLQVTGGYQQKVGETTLHYRLQIDGQLSMNTQKVQQGSHRLEVDLEFKFTCQLVTGSSMPPMMEGAPPMSGVMQQGGGGGMAQMGGGMQQGGGMAQMGGGMAQMGGCMQQGLPQGMSSGQMGGGGLPHGMSGGLPQGMSSGQMGGGGLPHGGSVGQMGGSGGSMPQMGAGMGQMGGGMGGGMGQDMGQMGAGGGQLRSHW